MTLLLFVFGLVIGSFLNVCIYRIPEGISIATPPSNCGYCKKRLKPLDLIPIISWLLLGGKCRYCGENINIRYPLIEILTGILFTIIFWRYGLNWSLLPYLALTAILIVATFIDIDYQIIPNKVNLFALIVFCVLNLAFGYVPWKSALIGGLIGGGFLFLLTLFTGGKAMGMGDVKFMAVIGLYLGWPNTIVALFLAFILGGIFGVFLLVSRVKEKKDAIPFGPWISLAAFISILFGQDIVTWYIAMI